MRNLTSYLFASLILITMSLSAVVSAHHSYVTKYHPKKKIAIKGVITSVSYYNPHIFFTVSVRNRDGSETGWQVETESIQMTRARGLAQAKLKTGKKVTIRGWKARSGGAEIGLSSIKFASGGWIHVRSRPR